LDNTSSKTRDAFVQLKMDLAQRALQRQHLEVVQALRLDVELAQRALERQHLQHLEVVQALRLDVELAQRALEWQHLEAAQALPAGWEFASGSPWTHLTPFEEQGPVMVEVDRASAVFRDCERRFQQAGMVGVPLKRVERVQNPELWTNYRKACEALEHMGAHKNEQWLFHGTSRTQPLDLARHKGIDHRYSNDRNLMFGKGAYFAERSDYSNQPDYVHKRDQGERQMFLAQVAAGRVQALGRHQRDPNIKHPAQGFDSIRGHVKNPDYHAVVVYDVSRSYPTYLLTF
jgi:hypothetical protein